MAGWRFPYSDIVERLFGRGIEDAQGLVSPGTVQPVVLFDDLSDRAPHHQNPLYSGRGNAAAQAGVVSAAILQATTRPIRVLYAHVDSGSVYVYTRLTDTRTANQAAGEVEPLGPKIEAPTAASLVGTIGAGVVVAGEFDAATWLALGFILDPGTFLVASGVGINSTIRVAWFWEELPVPD